MKNDGSSSPRVNSADHLARESNQRQGMLACIILINGTLISRTENLTSISVSYRRKELNITLASNEVGGGQHQAYLSVLIEVPRNPGDFHGTLLRLPRILDQGLHEG